MGTYAKKSDPPLLMVDDFLLLLQSCDNVA